MKLSTLLLALIAICAGLVLFLRPSTTAQPAATQSRPVNLIWQDFQTAVSAQNFQASRRLENELVKVGPSAIPTLKAQLENRSAQEQFAVELRQRSAWVLGLIGGKATAEVLDTALKNGDEVPSVRAQILLGLSKVDDKIALEALKRTSLNSDEPVELRKSAVQLLAKRNEPEAADFLIENFSKSGDAKAWFVEALGFSPHAEPAAGFLQSLLKSSESESVRAEAALALARLNKDKAVGTLAELLQTEPAHTVRHYAVRGLQTMPWNVDVARVLGKALAEDENEGVRMLAADGIGHVGAIEVLPALCARFAQEPSVIVRLKLVRAIGIIGGQPAVEVFEKLAASETLPRVRNLMVQEAQRIRDGKPPVKATGEMPDALKDKEGF